MAKLFLSDINLSQNEIKNVVIDNLASAPGTPLVGQMYYNTTSDILFFYNGTAWVSASEQDLNAVLTKGNTTGAQDIIVTNGQSISSSNATTTKRMLVNFNDGGISADYVTIRQNDGTSNGGGLEIGAGNAQLQYWSAGGADLTRMIIAGVNTFGFEVPSGEVALELSGASFTGTLTQGTLTAARTWTFPDATGTVALTSDIVPVTIAAGSSGFLSVSNNEISVNNLLITDVTVDTTSATIAAFVAASYTVGNEFQEGDLIVLTAATDSADRTWIHNGGTAVTAADFTRVSSTLDAASVRGFFSGGAGIAYNSTTGVFSITDDNKGVQVNADSLEIDATEVAATGRGLNANGTNSWQLEVDGADIAGNGLVVNGTNSYQIDINAASSAEAEAQTLTTKVVTPASLVNFGKQQTFDITGDNTTTSFVLNHALSNQWVSVQVYQAGSPFAQVQTDIELTDANNATIKFDVAPATATNYKVVIIGS